MVAARRQAEAKRLSAVSLEQNRAAKLYQEVRYPSPTIQNNITRSEEEKRQALLPFFLRALDLGLEVSDEPPRLALSSANTWR